MRISVAIPVAFLALGVACSPPGPLVGEWHGVRARIGDYTLAPQEAAAQSWVFGADGAGFVIANSDTTRFQYQFAPDSVPMHLDITAAGAEGSLLDWAGVVELVGDTLRYVAIRRDVGTRPGSGELSNPFSFVLFGGEFGVSAVLRRVR